MLQNLNTLKERLDILGSKDFSNILTQQEKEDIWSLNNKALQYISEIKDIQRDAVSLNVAFVGEYSAGKSSVINSLLQEDLIPTDDRPMTLTVSRFKYSASDTHIDAVLKNGSVVPIDMETYEKLKHTNKEHLPEILKKSLGIDGVDKIKYIDFYYPSPILSNLTIIDTPGFSTSDKKGDDEKTIEAIKELADVVIWVVDAKSGTINESSIKHIENIRDIKNNIKIFVIVNKADSISRSNLNKVIEHINGVSKFEKVLPYSAKILEYKKEKETIKAKIEEFVEKILNENTEAILNIRRKKKKSLFKQKNIIRLSFKNNLKTFNNEFTLYSPDMEERLVKYKKGFINEIEHIRNRSKEYLYNSISKSIEELFYDYNKIVSNISYRLNEEINNIYKEMNSNEEYKKEVKGAIKYVAGKAKGKIKSLEYDIEKIYKNISEHSNQDEEYIENLIKKDLKKVFCDGILPVFEDVKDFLRNLLFSSKFKFDPILKDFSLKEFDRLSNWTKEELEVGYEMFENIASEAIINAELFNFSKDFIDYVINEEFFLQKTAQIINRYMDSAFSIIENVLQKEKYSSEERLHKIEKAKKKIEELLKEKNTDEEIFKIKMVEKKKNQKDTNNTVNIIKVQKYILEGGFL